MSQTTIPGARKLGKQSKKMQSAYHRELNKRLKYSGSSHMNVRGKTIPEKVFSQVTKCCERMCHGAFTKEDQFALYKSFYSNQSKEMQDQALGEDHMKSRIANTHQKNSLPRGQNHWVYFIKFKGEEISVCRNFIIKLYQITEKRIRVIQNKVRNELSFTELRGKHGNRPKKLKREVWVMIREHLKLIPARRSQYAGKKSRKLYFEDPNLSWSKLYTLFELYYHENMGTDFVKPAFHTYQKYLRQKLNYGFRLPRSENCGFCLESRRKLADDPDNLIETKYETKYVSHTSRHEQFKRLKEEKIRESRESRHEILVIDFDYAPNYPLPKTPEILRFYKTSLWLYLFNIHCYNDDSSKLYYFLETESKKTPDTVCSFLFHFLVEKLKPHTKTIYLFSDADGGQNKNLRLIGFCSWFAKTYKVDIVHMFPESGHSFSQCDRNFGLCRTVTQNEERIHVADEYIELFAKARKVPSPFILEHGQPLLRQWPFSSCPKPKDGQSCINFKIESYVRLQYRSEDNEIIATPTYGTGNEVRFTYSVPNIDIERLPSPPRVPITLRKQNDIISLFEYMSDDARLWYNNVFEESRKTSQNNPEEEENTDDVFSEWDSDGELRPERFELPHLLNQEDEFSCSDDSIIEIECIIDEF